MNNTSNIDAAWIAKDLNRGCMDAAMECPQSFNFYEIKEYYNGKLIDIGNLHKQGLSAVIMYWGDRNTTGGALLWDKGYSEELSSHHLRIFADAKKVMEDALVSAFGS